MRKTEGPSWTIRAEKHEKERCDVIVSSFWVILNASTMIQRLSQVLDKTIWGVYIYINILHNLLLFILTRFFFFIYF